MIELPALLLALAFVAVGVAAWFMGRLTGAARTVRLPRDYYVGLDHLINDRFDHAVEIFARMAEADGDAAEIQFALGSLFRRRGEVDRAIAIHSRMREQGGSSLQEKAAFALALDYLSAGLMDRAERLLEELSASREYRKAALDHLVRIYESQGDWANALKIFHALPQAMQIERRRVAAHYLCELAEQALVQGDVERARTLLRQARTHQADLPRADVLTARIMDLAGDSAAALSLYFKALEESPGLALEIIPRVLGLWASAAPNVSAVRASAPPGMAGLEALLPGTASGTTAPLDPDVLKEIALRLRRSGTISSRQLAWVLATALPPQEVRRLPDITGEAGSETESAADARSLGALLTRIGDAGGRYQCEDCGLLSVGWYWRCPKCRSWDSMQPSVLKWAEKAEERAL
ncbi:MAG TPA: tetratricopeptide repeat protein [Steroidobacteraceae bacterium]|nr:tetratricopeptide repeat protein [Steroidobacteraceae bacterium]